MLGLARTVAGLFGAWLMLLPLAAGAQSVRVAIVLDEIVDGEARPESDVAAVVIEELAARPRYVVVDPDQAQGVRKAVHGRSLLQADVQGLVTSLDADYLLVGEVRFEQVTTDGTAFAGVKSFNLRGRTKLIAVDSAQILGAPRPKGGAMHPVSVEAALARTADEGGKNLAAAVAALIDKQPTPRLELFVELAAPLDPAAAHETVGCLATETQSEVHLIAQHESGLQIEIVGPRRSSELTSRFGARGLCGLFVKASSRHAVRAAYKPAVQVPVLAARFTLAGERRDAWLKTEVPRILLTELSGLHFVIVDPAEAVRARLPQKRRGALGLTGSIADKAGRLTVSARVVALFTGSTVSTETVSCPSAEWSACVDELSAKISSELLGQVMAHRDQIPVGKAISLGRPVDLLVLSTPHIPGVYPSRLAFYDREPIGTIAVRNQTKQPVTRISAYASVEGLSKEAEMAFESKNLKAGQTVDVPLRLALEPAKLKSHEENSMRVLSVRIEYAVDGFRYEQRKAFPVMVYSRNALDWRQPSSIGSFVTSDVGALDGVVREVRAALTDDQLLDPLALPVALFRSLDRVRYAPDKVNPFRPDDLDYVQFPVETLALRSGDCDDLAVTYAALLESAGVPSMLIQTPGHVFVGVGTSVAPSNLEALAVGERALVVREGRTWIPVETTKLGATFASAWQAGRAELGQTASAGGMEQFIVVRSAWRTYPPTNLAAAAEVEVSVPTAEVVGRELAELEAQRSRELKQIMARLRRSSRAEDLNRLGVLLAHAGDMAGAKDAFDRSLQVRATAPAQNNRGNVALVTKDASSALAHYAQALEMPDATVEVRLNAVLATHVLANGDPRFREVRAEHIAAAVSQDPVAVSAFLARLPSGELTGAQAGGASLAGLVGLLQTELAAREGVSPRATTASASGGVRAAEHVHWLD